MKTTVILSMLALAAAPAFAGEGNSDPYPLHVRGVSTTMRLGTVGSSQNPYPYTASSSSVAMKGGIVGSTQNPFPYSAPGQQLTLDTPAIPGGSSVAQSHTPSTGG